jgi:alkylated DNA repair protein (DNA oxidative demethylase)
MTGKQAMKKLSFHGFDIYKDLLSPGAQASLVEDLRQVIAQAPMFSPQTPQGQKMSVRMTSAGSVGWYSDQSGDRYAQTHPAGTVWPDIPDPVLDIWRQVSGVDRLPDSCLINFYSENARMSLHQDKDEADLNWPVVSVSLGDDALFRVGQTKRGGQTRSVWLQSGDVVVMAGDARLAYHGIDRIRFGSSRLLPKGGRINLTLRIAT